MSLHTGITYSESQRGEVTLKTFAKLFRHIEYIENDQYLAIQKSGTNILLLDGEFEQVDCMDC